MEKKKILKLTDEQYYKYIMSLKNDGIIKNGGDTAERESFKKDGVDKKQ